MAALTDGRNTPKRSRDTRGFPVAASTIIYPGALVALTAADVLVPGSTSTTLICVGRAEERKDNSAGADGDKTCQVGAGVYRYDNSASADLIETHDIGADCYIVDDQTVALTNGGATRSIAGKIFDVDAKGVWVEHF